MFIIEDEVAALRSDNQPAIYIRYHPRFRRSCRAIVRVSEYDEEATRLAAKNKIDISMPDARLHQG
jgi:hypothetical protein